MSIRFLFFLLSFPLAIFACATSQNQPTIEQYNQFAIKSAELQLWNEAIFRWNQILDIDPQNARVYNNLGVAYEAQGKIDEATESYKRATELDSRNKYYRFNYRKCRLHVRRNKKDQATPNDEAAPNDEEEAEPPS